MYISHYHPNSDYKTQFLVQNVKKINGICLQLTVKLVPVKKLRVPLWFLQLLLFIIVRGFGDNDILEKVYLKFCKIILHPKATTPNYVIYGELGRYLLDIDIKLRNISYWATLITGKDITIYYFLQVNIFITK